MSDTHFISRIKQIRAGLMGEISILREKIRVLQGDIHGIESKIHSLDDLAWIDDPNYQPDTVLPVRRRVVDPSKPSFGPHELPRMLTDLIREASAPPTVKELTDMVAARRPDIDKAYIRTRLDKIIVQKKRAGVYVQVGERAGRQLIGLIR